MADTIQEFLVGIGFKIDESALRKMREAMQSTKVGVEKLTDAFKIDGPSQRRIREGVQGIKTNVEGLALAFSGAAFTFVKSMEAIADQFEALYFQSQRTGVVAGQLQAFQFGAQRADVSATALDAALAGLFTQMRMLPGVTESNIHSLTQFKGAVTDPEVALKALVTQYREFMKAGTEFKAIGWERIFPGVTTDLLAQLARNQDTVDAYERWLKSIPVDAKAATERGHEMAGQFDKIAGAVGKLREDFLNTFGDDINKKLGEFTDSLAGPSGLIAQFVNLDKATKGVIYSLGIVLTSLGTIAASRGLFRLLTGMGAGGAPPAAPAAAPPAAPAVPGVPGGGIMGWFGSILGQIGPEVLLQELLKKWQEHPETDPLGGLKKKYGVDQTLPQHQQGGLIMHTGPAMLHSGEMVLPQQISLGLQALIAGMDRAMAEPGQKDVDRELSDWLHGATSLVPQVKIEDQFGAGPGAGGGTVGENVAAMWGGRGFGGPGGTVGQGAARMWGGGRRGGGSDEGPLVFQGGETPGAGGPNPFLAKERAGYGAELEKNPALKRELAALVQMENPAAGTAVVESLFNRLAYLKSTGKTETVEQMMHGGFYGPENRGQVLPRLAQMSQAQIDARFKQISQALTGSDIIRSFTDQGSRGDPNYERGGIGVNFSGERFNLWGGATAARQRWREEREKQIAAAAVPGADTYGPQLASNTTNNAGHQITIDNSTSIHVAAGDLVSGGVAEGMVKRQNADMIRNMQGAIR